MAEVDGTRISDELKLRPDRGFLDRPSPTANILQENLRTGHFHDSIEESVYESMGMVRATIPAKAFEGRPTNPLTAQRGYSQVFGVQERETRVFRNGRTQVARTGLDIPYGYEQRRPIVGKITWTAISAGSVLWFIEMLQGASGDTEEQFEVVFNQQIRSARGEKQTAITHFRLQDARLPAAGASTIINIRRAATSPLDTCPSDAELVQLYLELR